MSTPSFVYRNWKPTNKHRSAVHAGTDKIFGVTLLPAL